MQHFLLSPHFRNLPSNKISRLSDDEAFHLLKTARWGMPEKPNNVICPRCRVRHTAYFIPSRKQWQRKHCTYRFSITAGTIFHLSKLSLHQILMAIYYFSTTNKGISALQLSVYLGVQYKTAWVLLHKLREALNQTKNLAKLRGEVHIDGCYVNNYIRQKNNIQRRIDRRKRRYQRSDKACVLIFRQRAANQDIIQGADRSIVALLKEEENGKDIRELTYALVEPQTKICVDEHPSYDTLDFHYDLWRVNHSKEFCAIDGTTNNLAESFFARFRRTIIGIYHRMHNNYMMLYANETAWREDMRRKSNQVKFSDVLERALRCRPSRDFVGYWQGNKKPDAKFGLASVAINDVQYLKAA